MSIINILANKLQLSPGEEIEIGTWLDEIENNARALNSFTSSGGGAITGLSAGNVEIDWSEGVTLFNPDIGKKTVHINPYGDMLLGTNIDKPANTSMAVWSRSQTYNSEAVSAGDLMLGDNSTSKANMYWDVSTGQLLFRGGTTVQAYVDTDGSITAGGGDVIIDADGIQIETGSGNENQIRWMTAGVKDAWIDAVHTGTAPDELIGITVEAATTDVDVATVNATFKARNDNNKRAQATLFGESGTIVTQFRAIADDRETDPADSVAEIVANKVRIYRSVGSPEVYIEGDGSLYFIGTDGGAGQGIYYEDSGGTDRLAISFPGSDVVKLANRAANGVVKLYANTSTAGSGGETLVGTIEDNQVQWEVSQIIENDKALVFRGTSGGANGGIKFEDSSGTDRSALIFPGSNVTELGNRGANGKVKIYANTATAGSGGNTLVITVEDNKVYIENGIDLFTTGFGYSNYYTSSTIQGFASITTGHIFTKKVGDIAHVWFDLTGTSGGATPTVLNFLLPFATTAQHRTSTFIRGRDNGTWLFGWAQIATGSPTRVDCYTTAGAAGWTATGNKAARGYICFHAA